jgi:pentatricopeptide repeat protein
MRIYARTSPAMFLHTNCNHVKHLRALYPTAEQALANQFASLLRACSDASVLQQGRQVHAQVILRGVSNDCLLGGRVLGMYVLCGSFVDAKNTFYMLERRSSLPWNWMIRGFTIMGRFDFALLFYFKMLGCGTSPDKYTFPYVIKACNGLNNVSLVKSVNKTIRLMGFELDVFIASSLIKFYAENDCINDARCLFDKMPHKDCVLWNVMLNSYVKNGDPSSALEIFLEMKNSEIRPNSVTVACILSVCASETMISLGTQLHGLVVRYGLELDTPVANTLLAMYSKCQNLFDACKLFDTMAQTDLVTWNGMITGFVQNGFMGEASHLFREMISVGIKPDSITFASFLPSVTELACVKQGKEIHGYMLRHGVPLDLFVKSALIDIYFKCRDVEMAHKIFLQSDTIDVILCTTMVSGFVLNGMNCDALEIFRWLIKQKMRPNSVTLASVLPACAGLAALNLGKELHCNILKNGLDGRCHVGSAISYMYAKCGRLDLAHHIFGRMSERDTVCWNSMITSCSQNGKPEEAIELFRQMGMEGTRYDCVSISAALSACANLPSLRYGKEIHGVVVKGAFSPDLFAESALVDMYAKCGNLNSARSVFDKMQGKNEVSWNSIISAYGNHGLLKDCLTLFDQMLENRFFPDHVTFLAILSACGHAGQVDIGACYFCSMTEEYGIPARMEHYACMVDLFGRAGQLNEAYEMIKSMPFTPDAGVWGTLLGACRVHSNVELAEVASRHLFDLDPQNSGYYVLLSNLHADAGQWGGVLKIRSLMKERQVQKVPGYSWIDINNTTHIFVAADGSHPQSAEIYSTLKSLLLELRKEGYVPQPYLPMHSQSMGM